MGKTVLIGWDGATFDVLQPYWEAGIMPFLRDFVGRGVRAELKSVIPPLTPSAWTSCITGQSPARHGIFDFARINRSDGVKYRWATSGDIQSETLWSMANRHGIQVTSLNFPLMLPPPPIDGHLIPAFVPLRQLRRNIHPRSLYDSILALPGFDPKELVFDLDRERKAIQLLSQDEYEEWILFHIRREERWLDIFRYLVDNSNSDLMAVLFDGPDKLQHACWRFIDPKLVTGVAQGVEQKARDLCQRYFQRLDSILGDIIELVGTDSSIVIVSDHGFGPTSEVFYINAWLAAEGFLEWAPGVLHDDECRMVLPETTQNPAPLFNWSKTRACSMSSGGNGIYINVPEEQYLSFREHLRQRLLSFEDPETGERVITRALTREEAFLGIEPRDAYSAERGEAPDITVELRDGGFVSILNSTQVLRSRKQIMGTHRPNGVFLAAGRGFKRNASIPPLSILDITPALLHALGLSIPADLEGKFPVEAFDEAFLRDVPPRIGPPTMAPEQENNALEAAESALITERLKALGYID